MNLDELTLGQVKQLQSAFGSAAKEPIAEVGKSIFVRTVTHYYTGRVVKCNADWMELTDAAWIADSGRFHQFLKDGALNEVEPFVDPVRIPVGAVIDVTEWKHALPRSQK